VLVLPMLLLLPLWTLLPRIPQQRRWIRSMQANPENSTASASQDRVLVLPMLLLLPLWTLLLCQLRPMRLPHFASALIVVESPLKGLRSMHS
jgi:hypothetical protein